MRRKGSKPQRSEGRIIEERSLGAGRRITISISKTRKMTARRKNRVEKGSRAEREGSNPHSKGESFSRSLVERAFNLRMRRKSNRGRARAIMKEAKPISMVGCAGGNGKLTIFYYGLTNIPQVHVVIEIYWQGICLDLFGCCWVE